jgi:hypothetical protein
VGDGNLIGHALFELKRAKLALKSNTFVLLSSVFDPILQIAISLRQLFQYFVGTSKVTILANPSWDDPEASARRTPH